MPSPHYLRQPADQLDKAIAYYIVSKMMDTPDAEASKLTARQIAQDVERVFNRPLGKDDVYKTLRNALRKGFLRKTPPRADALGEQLGAEFGFKGKFHVVNAIGDFTDEEQRAWAGDQLCLFGAIRVLEVIKSLSLNSQSDKKILIGVGPGRATYEWAVHFNAELRCDPASYDLELVAITAGGNPRALRYTPNSFFGLFPPDRVATVGLFGPTLIKARELNDLRSRKLHIPGIEEAVIRRSAIDIIVSSMGDPADSHDLLTQYLKQANVPVPPNARGNFQYRYYDEHAPLMEKGRALRPFTIMELNDYRDMVTSGKHVILLARACSACGLSRAAALRPLLTVPELKVWSEIILDVKTASDLLHPPASALPKGNSTVGRTI